MTAAVIYARISKDDNDDRLGVDRQERLCRELAERDGLDVVEVVVDNDVSATRLRRRPGFERLVGLIEAGEVGAVLAVHTDRLYRKVTDLERLVTIVEAHKTQVRTLSSGNVDLTTASGRMVARMLGAAAQHEVERLGERMRAKWDERAAAGTYPGGRPPYGYSSGYVVNTIEADAVRLMARRVLEGASLLSIARELDAAGVRTREGRSWHHSSVRATLVNPAIAGLRVHRREVAGPGAWEPVLDRATWEEVRAVLADPARKRTRPALKYLLAGMVTNENGDPMNGRPERNIRTYATRHPGSPQVQVPAEPLEELVVEMVLSTLDDAVLPEVDGMRVPSAGAEVVSIEEELADLAKLRGEGTISLAEWLAAREPLHARLDAARSAAGQSRRPTRHAALLSEPGAVRKAWEADRLDFAAKREILQTVIERIQVGRANRGRWTTIEERLLPENGGQIVWKV
jgi:site-specific DNA recombinase